MTGILIATAVGGFLLLFTWAARTPSRWEVLIQNAAKDGHLDPLLEELSARPEMLQPKFYNEAMTVLVHANLAVATQLTLIFVPQYPEDRRCQYWLRALYDMEPRSPLLTSTFLEQHHRACCSPAGG